MQVSAINYAGQSFQSNKRKRDNVDEVISYNDQKICDIALKTALDKEKHRRKTLKRIYYSVPLIGGLAAAALTRGKSTFLSTEVSGLAAKAANGIKSAGNWSFLLGTAVATSMGLNAAEKKSKTLRNFRNEHPILTFLGQCAAFFAATTFIPLGASKLYSKIKPEHLKTIGKGVNSIAGHLNNIKAPEFIKNAGAAISKHTPDWAKSIGETVLSYAPHITLFTGLISSFRNDAKTASDFYGTYAALKDGQTRLAQARVNELKQQVNDFEQTQEL